MGPGLFCSVGGFPVRHCPRVHLLLFDNPVYRGFVIYTFFRILGKPSDAYDDPLERIPGLIGHTITLTSYDRFIAFIF